MESRVERAIENHKNKYNCSQAIACAYCDLVGADEVTMYRAGEGLGMGLGGKEGTCGAVSAACMIAGMMTSNGELGTPGNKAVSYDRAKQIVQKFQEENGTIVCKELKGIETGTPVKPCRECVRDAARILEEVMADF